MVLFISLTGTSTVELVSSLIVRAATCHGKRSSTGLKFSISLSEKSVICIICEQPHTHVRPPARTHARTHARMHARALGVNWKRE